MLELIKVRKLLISDDIDEANALLDASTRFVLNTEMTDEETEYSQDETDEGDVQLTISEIENN